MWNASDTVGTVVLQIIGMLLLYVIVSQIKQVFTEEDITGAGAANANPGDGYAINSNVLKDARADSASLS